MHDSMGMKLTINGEEKQIARESASVTELLEELGMAGKPVAVEVNRKLVFKRNHETTQLSDGDKVEIVTMVGGG